MRLRPESTATMQAGVMGLGVAMLVLGIGFFMLSPFPAYDPGIQLWGLALGPLGAAALAYGAGSADRTEEGAPGN